MTSRGRGTAAPEGYEPYAVSSPFMAHNGPYYENPRGDGVQLAFQARAAHCNNVGLVHGGMLTAFLDSVMGRAAARLSNAAPVTINLSVNFLDMGRAGDWIFGEGRVTRASRDLAFVESRARVGDRDLARASAVFKLMRRGPA
jgi:uncharacterized protein (TIGR00369 family)